jgi:hypothetical protein
MKIDPVVNSVAVSSHVDLTQAQNIFSTTVSSLNPTLQILYGFEVI